MRGVETVSSWQNFSYRGASCCMGVLLYPFFSLVQKLLTRARRALIGTVGEQLQIACGSNGVNSEGTGILFQYLVWFYGVGNKDFSFEK